MNWPWPGDSTLDRSRTVARRYREALHSIAPDMCESLDRCHQDWGQGWAIPQQTHVQLDDQLTADEAADYCQVAVKTVFEWRRRGLRWIDTAEGSRYVARDLIEFQRVRREKRMGGAA